METKEQRPFVMLCNNFIDAKYIMMGNNIIKLLESINNDDSLREVVKKCIANFDFTTELGIAISAGQNKPKNFVMPKENEKIVALCYLILQQIALNKIDYEAFTSKHFVYDGTINDIYKNFGHYFILPFRNAMLYLENAKNIQIETNNDDENLNEDDEEHSVDSYVSRLDEICLDMERVVDSDYKIKEDKGNEIKFYNKALKEAIKLKNRTLIIAMAQVLLNEIGKIKSLRGIYDRLYEVWDEI